MGASSPVNPLSNENKCHRLEHMQAQAGTSWIMHRSALNGKRHETWQDDKNEQCYPMLLAENSGEVNLTTPKKGGWVVDNEKSGKR